ncbi:hypothetical protein RSK20926_18552 [Roseobacter sp. SK209-2-6]|nr:hypothetical protein RSK20926_18552 [Roseobacter sp. SK209-2-6]
MTGLGSAAKVPLLAQGDEILKLSECESHNPNLCLAKKTTSIPYEIWSPLLKPITF